MLLQRKTAALPAAACAALVLAALTSCARPADPAVRRARPNVVLVSIDSLRADHVGAYGYPKPTTPTIDRLAAGGLVFDHAFSSTSWTLPAHTALFTGMDDITHTVTDDSKRLPHSIPVLPEILRGSGYQTVGFFSGPYLDPGFGFGRGFDEYHNCTSYARPAAGDVPDAQALRASHRDVTNPILLENIRARIEQGLRQPFFLFIHFWDVHYDYIPPERDWRLFDPDYTGTFTGQHFERNRRFRPGMDEADFRHVVALYDGEIHYTDDTLGRVLDDLKRHGLLDDTLVVVTADHGDEFLEHGGKGHGHTLFDEVVHIPLIFWQPGRLAPGRDRRLASITDVAPTILDRVGIEPALKATGVSLSGPPDPSRQLLLELQVPAWFTNVVALRTRGDKLVANRRAQRTDAYDLRADPAEQHPQLVATDSPPRYVRLRRAL
jgi:arylsulfatase A-like enzyme